MGTIVRYLTFIASLYFAGPVGIDLLESIRTKSIKNIVKGFHSTSALSRGLNP